MGTGWQKTWVGFRKGIGGYFRQRSPPISGVDVEGVNVAGEIGEAGVIPRWQLMWWTMVGVVLTWQLKQGCMDGDRLISDVACHGAVSRQ